MYLQKSVGHLASYVDINLSSRYMNKKEGCNLRCLTPIGRANGTPHGCCSTRKLMSYEKAGSLPVAYSVSITDFYFYR